MSDLSSDVSNAILYNYEESGTIDVCVMDEWWVFYIYCVSCIVNGIVIVIL